MMESKRLEHLIIRLLGIVVISAMVMSAYAVNRVKELEDQLARFGIAQVKISFCRVCRLPSFFRRFTSPK